MNCLLYLIIIIQIFIIVLIINGSFGRAEKIEDEIVFIMDI
jgi:hypothetical protein